MKVRVTTGAIRCAKLQSNVTTNKPTSNFFTGRMPFLSPNQERQITEGKIYTINCLYLYTVLFVLLMVKSSLHCTIKMKKALGETQTLRTACSKALPKIFSPLQTPFPGAQDGQNSISWRRTLPLPINPV